jgi:hypothetical protein
MVKIIDYIKKNKLYILVLIIGLIFLLMQMSKVVMYADDFSLKLISNGGLSKILQNQYEHYFSWGGGFTPLLVTTFLLGKFYYWKIFISLIFLFIIIFSIKLFNIKEDKERAIFSLLMWDCLFFVSIYVTSQTMYWLDGSMAYVFTTFQVFIYIYLLISRVYNNYHKKYDAFIVPLCAFLSGWSSAQSGAVIFIIPTVILLIAKYVDKKSIRKLDVLSNILGVIGFGIFYFAPGNSARMGYWEFYNNLNFFEKITYRINDVFQIIFDFQNKQFTSIPFFNIVLLSILIVLSLEIIKSKKLKSVIFEISTYYLLGALTIFMFIKLQLPGYETLQRIFLTYYNLYNNVFTIKIIIPYIFSFITLIMTLINCFVISRYEKKSEIFIFPLISYFAQGVMVMAPYSEYRTEFLSLIFIWITISFLIIIIKRNKINTLPFLFIPFIMININLIILLVVLISFIVLYDKSNLNKMSLQLFSIIILFSYLSILNWHETYIKYSQNKNVYTLNIQKLSSWHENKENTIVLYAPTYYEYGFGNLVGLSYVEESLKIIYNIDMDTKFVLE